MDAYGASTNVEYEEREDAVVLKTSLIVRKDARARSSARPVTLAFIDKGATLDFTHEVQFVRQLIEVELPECREGSTFVLSEGVALWVVDCRTLHQKSIMRLLSALLASALVARPTWATTSLKIVVFSTASS